MGVAVRRYYRPPPGTTTTTWSPGWSCGTAATAGDRLLPGYGWIFGVGDGTVNVGLGILNTSKAFGNVDYRDAAAAAGWTARPRSGAYARRTPTGPIRGAALPMGFNRTPHYTRGLLLVGDAGGMVNPFNGEGIAYAMESGAARRRGHRAGARRGRPARRASARCSATRPS